MPNTAVILSSHQNRGGIGIESSGTGTTESMATHGTDSERH